jgi:alpha-N-arabinofuranosidase
MMAVNLGTRGIEEALDLLDYANHPSDTYRSDQRAANGWPEPHDIRLWCLGNEMDGDWQPGHKTAHEYARLAAETARVMKMYDPGLDLVASGSSHSGMATFGSWESTVLEETYEHVSHISCHQYYAETPDDLASFLASGVDLESFIEGVVATADAVRARGRHTKRINLSLDEWNVTFRGDDVPDTVPWQRAPRLIEDRYTATDAVVLGSLLIAMLRHADRVTAACLAQLVNVLAPILTEPGGPAWRQPTFYPFAQAARYGRGEVLQVDAVSPVESTERYGDVPVLHATATGEADGTVTLFAVNRGLTEPIRLAADLRALPGYQVTEHVMLSDSDPDDRLSRVNQNTFSEPDRVRPRLDKDIAISNGTLLAALPPVSWHVIRLGGGQPA